MQEPDIVRLLIFIVAIGITRFFVAITKKNIIVMIITLIILIVVPHLKSLYDEGYFDPDKKEAKAAIERAALARSKKDYVKAIEEYSKAIRLVAGKYDHHRYYYDRGNLYHYQTREFDKAIADYTEAIRLDDTNVYYYRAIGNIYKTKGDYDKAIANYTEAIKRKPYYDDIFKRAELYKQHAKDYDKAIADYTEAIKLKSSYVAYEARGDCHLAKGDYENAIADYEESLRLNPEQEGSGVKEILAETRKKADELNHNQRRLP